MKTIKIIPLLILLFILVSCIETDKEIVFKLNPGVDTVEIGTSWVDAGALLTIDGTQANNVVVDSEVNTNILGTYVVEYRYFTENNMIMLIKRYVDVVDQTKPEMTLNPGIDTIHVGETWVDAGVIVTDNSGESITPTVTSEVNINLEGFYTVTYRAEDQSGNFKEIIRIVSVIE